jgi:DUF3102 family protein
MSHDLAKLADLIRQIAVEHEACVAAAVDAMARYLNVGRLLTEAKTQVRHGEWVEWVETNCKFGLRQAQKYMRAYENREAIESEMRTGGSHLAALRGAIKALEKPSIDLNPEEFAAFIDCGRALTTIRDRQLYRGQYATFSDYLAGRWGITEEMVLLYEEIYRAIFSASDGA